MSEQKAKEMEELARQVKPLHAYLVSRGVPAMDAWDVVQEAFITIFKRQDTLPECAEQRNAILFSAVNFGMRAYFTEQSRACDRAARAHEYAVFMGMTQERDISGVLEAREQLEIVLPQIPAEQCQVFTDRVLDGLTVPEVAARLGMKANTTKGYWRRALETLQEKLESLEHRGVRGVLVFFAISSVLALAKNASAMVGGLRKFFRPTGHAQLRIVAGLAMAAAVILVPPNSRASADEDFANAPLSATAAGTATRLEASSVVGAPEKNASKEAPNVTQLPSPPVPSVVPRQTAPKKFTMNAGPPDYLISMTMSALRYGNPQRALELLDRYVATNGKAANARSVQTLRAQAQQAIAARH
ncbi:MAG: hypothetical protein IPM54_25395 [Polyangiaceae bacterium]|nr:hypothetical protein [Polyangiaceae bacterium]